MKKTANLLLVLMALASPCSMLRAQEQKTVTVPGQTTQVTGTITSKGVPLQGATVVVKGTSTSTLTDEKGVFRIKAPKGSHLTITYVGMEPKDVEVGSLSTINIDMDAATITTEDVVVVGYGTSKRKNLTGAVASVKAADIVLSPVSSPMEALQGRVAGLDIQRTSGKAGTTPEVLLRGNRSISASQSPLYLIDGIPGSINMLNPNDIETIDVLKDAAATSIYGVAGANGVIIITTKKAKAGKIQVDIDSYYGINGYAEFPKALTGDAWLQYLNEKFYRTNNYYTTDPIDLIGSADVKALVQAGKWVDWVDETLQNGSQQNHFVSLRGGSDKIQAYMSLGYIGEKGIYKNDESQIINLRTGIDAKFSKMLKAGIQVVASGRNSNSTASRVNKSYGIAPVGEPYLPDGSINLYPYGANNATVSPIANYAPGVLIDEGKNFNLNVYPYVELTPFKNFTIRSNFGANVGQARDGFFQNERSYNLAAEGRTAKEASYGTSMSYGYIWENFFTYNFNVKDDHQFSLTGITSMSASKNEGSTLAVNGLDFDSYSYYNLGAASTVTGRSTSYSEASRLSYAGRLNYNYKGKYIVTLSNRWDGASQLYNHWAAFPSVAAAWRLGDETFMQGTKNWLSNLKLRASWGVTGNNGISPYQSFTEIVSKTANANLSLGGGAILPIYVLKQALGNPDLGWEKSYSYNLGLDFSVLKNRLDVTIDAYSTKTDGVLYKRTMPSSSGGFDAKNLYTKVLNIAETENKGIELGLNSRNIVNKNFQWTTSFTFTRATEKLVNIDLGNSTAVSALISENLFLGQPLKTFYGYKKLGVWQKEDSAMALRYGARPGDIKLETVPKFDANGKSDSGIHVYSAADRMIIGNGNPDWFMGMQNTFTYKGFDLTIFITGRAGQMINAALLGTWNSQAQPADFNYWTPSNPTNDFPQPGSALSSTYSSALNMVDGSFVKVKNITLGYSLPRTLQDKWGLSRLRFYGTIYNPLIYTVDPMLKGIDPESGGIDTYPLYKQIVFGLNLSF
ncbi:MAG TPA: TonB-dependent receptor [Phnomibacter sp.]|nr:TonB-dependent receptor [Phnomibacter sp.]